MHPRVWKFRHTDNHGKRSGFLESESHPKVHCLLYLTIVWGNLTFWMNIAWVTGLKVTVTELFWVLGIFASSCGSGS